MSYDPSQYPVGERIVQNVESTLLAIASPTYATDVRKVHRWDGNAFDAIDYPAITIVEGVEKTDDNVGKIIRHELPISLVIGLIDQDWFRKLKKLLADVRVALMTDHTRGGLAEDTKILSLEVFDSTPSEPLGVAQIDLRIRYRTLFHDPTTAQ